MADLISIRRLDAAPAYAIFGRLIVIRIGRRLTIVWKRGDRG